MKYPLSMRVVAGTADDLISHAFTWIAGSMGVAPADLRRDFGNFASDVCVDVIDGRPELVVIIQTPTVVNFNLQQGLLTALRVIWHAPKLRVRYVTEGQEIKSLSELRVS